ncbi:uncharacterized protein LOC118171555 [Oxyura jamaicensis]|uniref:uncharacterized protein LOC118171555 n=1 Tax=Oxyura jamaicensis TaxID=8884 RepID=UPI0015A6B30B|nr:uncharacterized protein LOC118171555 [Oxyura jamaicensis]
MAHSVTLKAQEARKPSHFRRCLGNRPGAQQSPASPLAPRAAVPLTGPDSCRDKRSVATEGRGALRAALPRARTAAASPQPGEQHDAFCLTPSLGCAQLSKGLWAVPKRAGCSPRVTTPGKAQLLSEEEAWRREPPAEDGLASSGAGRHRPHRTTPEAPREGGGTRVGPQGPAGAPRMSFAWGCVPLSQQGGAKPARRCPSPAGLSRTCLAAWRKASLGVGREAPQLLASEALGPTLMQFSLPCKAKQNQTQLS